MFSQKTSGRILVGVFSDAPRDEEDDRATTTACGGELCLEKADSTTMSLGVVVDNACAVRAVFLPSADLKPSETADDKLLAWHDNDVKKIR